MCGPSNTSRNAPWLRPGRTFAFGSLNNNVLTRIYWKNLSWHTCYTQVEGRQDRSGRAVPEAEPADFGQAPNHKASRPRLQAVREPEESLLKSELIPVLDGQARSLRRI